MRYETWLVGVKRGQTNAPLLFFFVILGLPRKQLTTREFSHGREYHASLSCPFMDGAIFISCYINLASFRTYSNTPV